MRKFLKVLLITACLAVANESFATPISSGVWLQNYALVGFTATEIDVFITRDSSVGLTSFGNFTEPSWHTDVLTDKYAIASGNRLQGSYITDDFLFDVGYSERVHFRQYVLVRDGEEFIYGALFTHYRNQYGWDWSIQEIALIDVPGIYDDYMNGADPVPEPGTMLLFGVGLAGVACVRRKQTATT